MSHVPLPDLEPLTEMDDRLRQVPRDRAAFDLALRQWLDEVDAARRSDDAGRIRRALNVTGSAYRILGAYSQAERDLTEALDLAKRAANVSATVAAEIRLAELDRCRDAFAASEERLRRVLATIEAGDDHAYLDFALQHLGKTLTDAGRPAEALPVLHRALALRDERGHEALIGSTREAIDRAINLAPTR